MAFVGTVLSVQNAPNDDPAARDSGTGTAHYRFRVDENFFGLPLSELDVYSGRGGADCSFHFKEGKQYLVVPYRGSNGALFATICSDTRGYQPADPFITTLRAIRDHKPVPSIFGILEESTEWSVRSESRPLASVKVRLTSSQDSQRFETVTDADGAYRIYDLPAGSYRVTADLPPGLEFDGIKGGQGLKFPTGTCYEWSLRALPATKIHGRLLDENGNVVSDLVELVKGLVYDPDASGEVSVPGADGVGFEFHNVAPGSYILVFNRKNRLDPSTPYPRTFYPGVSDPAKAIPVIVKKGEVVAADLHLSGRAPTVTLDVAVTWADERPVEQSLWVRGKPRDGVAASAEQLQPDLYRLTLLPGVRYSISASIYCGEICEGNGCRGNVLESPKTEFDVTDSSPRSLKIVIPANACPK